MKAFDEERVRAAEKAVTDFERKARKAKRLEKKKHLDKEEEESQYGAGMF